VLFATLAAILLLFVLPGDALAWGPGVHTAAARFVLANLDLLSPAVADMLARHPLTFRYGCLSADFFVGKGTRVKPGHSHNWESARRLSDAADTPQLAAHALGYCCHLAADVVAHNVYVPNVIADTAIPGSLTHVYVEMQADSRLTGGFGLGGKLAGRAQRAVDRSMMQALDKGAIGYYCRKRVFRGGVGLSGLRGWNRSLMFARRVMPLPDGGDTTLDEMFDLSLRCMLDVLHRGFGSVLTSFDPIGSRNLARAKRHVHADLDARIADLPRLPRHQDVAEAV